MQKNITIFKTNNYNMFNIIKENRSTHQGHVAKIMKSLKEVSLMEDIPILVDKQMNVIDGQHRLEACKLLDIPIWYKICDIINVNHIAKINSTNKSWKAEDYLKQYCEMNNENYIKFYKFMQWSGVDSVNMALKFIKNCVSYFKSGNGDSDTGVRGQLYGVFNDGTFIYPEDDTEARKRVISFKEFNKYCGKPYNRSAIVAYDIISKTKGYDNKKMMRNLAIKPVPPFNDAVTLIEHLDKIYNFNIKNSEQFLHLNRR